MEIGKKISGLKKLKRKLSSISFVIEKREKEITRLRYGKKYVILDAPEEWAKQIKISLETVVSGYVKKIDEVLFRLDERLEQMSLKLFEDEMEVSNGNKGQRMDIEQERKRADNTAGENTQGGAEHTDEVPTGKHSGTGKQTDS